MGESTDVTREPGAVGRFAAGRGGAVVVAAAILVVWFVVGQCLPGCGVGLVHALANGGKQLDEAAVTQAIAAWLPHITIFGAVVAAGTWLLLRALRSAPSSPARAGTVGAGAVALWTIAGCAATVALQFAISAAMSGLGVEAKEQPFVAEMLRNAGAPEVLAIVVAAPVGEEIVFRRLIHRTLAPSWGTGIGIAASTVLFALIHLYPPLIPNYLAIGLVCAIVYERTGHVGAAVFVHAANNAFAMIMHRS